MPEGTCPIYWPQLSKLGTAARLPAPPPQAVAAVGSSEQPSPPPLGLVPPEHGLHCGDTNFPGPGRRPNGTGSIAWPSSRGFQAKELGGGEGQESVS